MSMSKNQLRSLAKQAGFRVGMWEVGPPGHPMHHFIAPIGEDLTFTLEVFARLVQEAERVRCLQAIRAADDGDAPAYRHCEEVIQALA